ncbi:response regulator [Sinorhizobium medicae]|uniref:Response regulator n=2 Tax=Sinorhizobium medicae TaxID=110321 RepID=A0A508WVZ9_9HYPH|nr:response regulator [Sinorhizobium medicae]ABR61231.1 response regulator receiver protein [Sinorhizobium medicae WSM419]MBO1943397.1 response regulator [Sinorhizobium medicae]MBO1959068.1 response regulator [Sinorhizobium medicae]MDX0405720.1 response regulator [Sinorhizobium medicae]MDX0411240.1 response regulator [Sinorhizobium medicae]
MPVSDVPPAIESVLVLEDNFLIALDMEEMLVSLGVTSVHVATTKAKAMELIVEQRLDFAILDINLGDDTSFAVADALMTRGVRFGFTSGYGELLALPSHLRDVPRIDKPFSEGTLSSLIATAANPRDV